MSGAKRPDGRIAGRKLEHLRAMANDPEVERAGGGFERITLTHRALPELDFDAVDTATTFLGKDLRLPLLISSMTGGADAEILTINRNLAEAAERCGVAMAVGSQRVMFADPAAGASFDLRPIAPNVPLIGNIGAVQLNTGLSADECRAAIDVLGADGLYLHLNPLQEAVQPEGDRNFAGLTRAIADLLPTLPVPVLLKEVGAGLSVPDIERGYGAGIRHFDLAGRGGTSWSRIEYHRRDDDADDLGLVFQDWGRTTTECLLDAAPHLAQKADPTTLIASGGIRNGIDMAKSLILGADLCGVAGPLLSAAQISADAVVARIEKLAREFRTAMFLMGCARVEDLKNNTALIRSGAAF
ncbi:MAG: type 2 isopentenyl-diphosphate Delta-isomerase [Silicimonas sp.]|nr:type 2 isopentenyl-diphosphate Delta-isomerase [Silicimonas sp.]